MPQLKMPLSLTDSFWVDGYFEESSLERIREGDAATVKLMGYSQVVRADVGSLGLSRHVLLQLAAPGARLYDFSFGRYREEWPCR
jgi:hypothetical protein